MATSTTATTDELALRAQFEKDIASEVDAFYSDILEKSYRDSGAGSYRSQFHKSLAKIDRFGVRAITQNHVYPGLVFITRPKLNLTSANLRMSRVMSMLDSIDPTSIQFMIRMLLDTKLANDVRMMELVGRSPLIDGESPFLTPLISSCESVTGFPSVNIETYTTEGGFFSEDMTTPIGSDRNYKTFDLQASYVDIQGGACNALFQIWAAYIDKVTRGEMVQYAEDTQERRMGWTCSIYRFLLDPSMKYITNWCKCTGCFPVIRSSGAIFDFNRFEGFVEAAKKFNVTFKCNHMGEENDPIILKEFNMLVKRLQSAAEPIMAKILFDLSKVVIHSLPIDSPAIVFTS